MDGSVGEQRVNLVQQSLLRVHDAGAMIVSLTWDGVPANVAMLQELGCNIRDVARMKATFPYPATKTPSLC